MTTEVIPAIAPAVRRSGVVSSVFPGGIRNYNQDPKNNGEKGNDQYSEYEKKSRDTEE
jgi:hypothetical protein